ncbi:phosphotransferase [Olleya sp. HaHaR_3_96]|uniref:phosphotransferase n=1 Tax=Olleya sp. HaHaR_3_96 TaxID=2745560 RepID=UPI001C4FD2EA|nr:phosphotransferase [Olleya sp. HaHaR_3_96]QXP58773.1 phosphotransferase [Olleya sp. HaHaR_3_96]
MYLEATNSISDFETCLNSIGFLDLKEEYIKTIEKPGEGNMNVVLRIRTNRRSFIVKQSRPFVQKYQDIPAPIERIAVEYQFYKAVTGKSIKPHIPEILSYSADNYLLLLEDLGDCQDMSYLYDNKHFTTSQLDQLINIASQIHKSKPIDYPKNRTLRLLNHQHIFVLPFVKANGFSLDAIQEGLEDLALNYKADALLKKEIKRVGEQYLEEGNTLLHGDYYPGSWMTKGGHIYVIDPEFSFMGFAEFDMGVLAAHNIMISMDISCLQTITTAYPEPLNNQLLTKVAGIEIMRRIIGLAQLPLKRSIQEKKILLEIAHALILDERN